MRRLWLALVGSIAALALVAPAAHATMAWNATSHDFGSANVGINGVPKTFTLAVNCDAAAIMGICGTPVGGVHFFGAPAVTGDGFALGTPNTCGPSGVLVTPTHPGQATCLTTVTFKATSPGPKTGSLNLPTGPDIALSGAGVAVSAATPPAKKCKKKGKKRSAAAAKKKKCGKKKK